MKAEARKQQILEAALKAFAEHGYERTSIAVICHKAGIARPTLYQYFENKRSLFRELLESYLVGIHDRIHARQKAAADGKALSKREAMLSLHRELLEEISGNRDFFMIFFKEAKARNAETEDIVKGIMRAIMGEFMTEIRSEPGWEGMSDKELEFVVIYMLGGLMQTVEYYLFNDQHALSTQELAERITFIESRIKGE